MRSSRRGGRRPGESGTRELILGAARDSFAQRGYAGTTIRSVAADAGVDPALVHHFYGSKDDLFAAVLAVPADLARTLPTVLAGDPDGLGERVARFYLGLWEAPVTGAALRAVVRSAVSHEQAAALLREFIGSQLLVRLAPGLQRDQAELRVCLASTHLVGLAIGRYVVGVGPLAGAHLDHLVACVAPSVQRYLAGDLPGA